MDAAQHISASVLLDREQILIDSLLLRFRNIVELAPIAEGCVTKEAAAAQSFQIQVETAALIRACEDLLKLTRELKEMWLVGPLRGIGKRDDEAEKKMDENVEKVGKMIEELFIKEN